MADKVFVPKTNQPHWDGYWEKTNYQREMELVKSDGLRPIFSHYLNKKQAIIEAGCGAGKWVIYFTSKGYNITGVDNNRVGLAKLKQYYPQAQAKFGDVTALPFPDNSFDIYISLGVVEHFEAGPQQALEEAFRVVKPGGRAIVEVPFDNCLRRGRRLLGKFKFWRPPPKDWVFYEYRYTKAELSRFMAQAGFSKLRFFPKDDLDPQKSIGLWLDWPGLRRQPANPDFRLILKGQRLKKIIPRWWFSACVVCVGEKAL